jgi:hypothetical protein
MGLLSFPTTGKRLPWSTPFKRCVFFSFILITWTCLLFTVEAKSFQMNAPGILTNARSGSQIEARETHRVGRPEARSGTGEEMPTRY